MSGPTSLWRFESVINRYRSEQSVDRRLTNKRFSRSVVQSANRLKGLRRWPMGVVFAGERSTRRVWSSVAASLAGVGSCSSIRSHWSIH